MDGPHLVYFADAMCSWCWGFSPTIAAIQKRFGPALPIRLVMGGLRPGTVTPMEQRDRDETRGHWEHVREASGQPFDFGFFSRERFVYDTEPASRAIVVMRRQDPGRALEALRGVQSAFYAENRDVTALGTLAALAVELGFDAEGFLSDFASESAIDETRRDFAITQNMGVRGFPALLAVAGGDRGYAFVTRGFQPAERLLPGLEHWFDAVSGA